MQSVQAWIQANPVLFSVFLWPLVTASVSLIYHKLDAVPRVHAVLSLVVKAGFDVPGMLDALKRILTGAPPGGGTQNKPPPPAVTVAPFALMAALSLFCASCGAASPSVLSPRAVARSVVETASTAWLVGAKACVAVAQEQGDDDIRVKCRDAFMPARAGILSAASTVDAWTDASRGDVACALADAAGSLSAGRSLLASLGVASPGVLDDAIELVRSFSTACVRDGGTNG